MNTRVLALGGSQRARSLSLNALKLSAEAARKAGAAVEVLSIRELDIPLYDPSAPDLAPGAQQLIKSARVCDGLLIASPVYAGTVSGAVKNALDHLHVLTAGDVPALTGRVVGLIAVGEGNFNRGAVTALVTACQAMGAWVDPAPVLLCSIDMFNAAGELYDPIAIDDLQRLGRRIVEASAARRRADVNLSQMAGA